jgi:hypothetical protein
MKEDETQSSVSSSKAAVKCFPAVTYINSNLHTQFPFLQKRIFVNVCTIRDFPSLPSETSTLLPSTFYSRRLFNLQKRKLNHYVKTFTDAASFRQPFSLLLINNLITYIHINFRKTNFLVGETESLNK